MLLHYLSVSLHETDKSYLFILISVHNSVAVVIRQC